MKRKREIAYLPVYWFPLKGTMQDRLNGEGRMRKEDAAGLPVPSTWEIQVTAGGKVLRTGKLVIEKSVPWSEIYKETPETLSSAPFYTYYRIWGTVFDTRFIGDWGGFISYIHLEFGEKVTNSEDVLSYTGILERDASGKATLSGEIKAKGLPVPLHWKARPVS